LQLIQNNLQSQNKATVEKEEKLGKKKKKKLNTIKPENNSICQLHT